MSCRKNIDPVDGRIEEVPNPKGMRYAVKGTCPECGTGIHKFASKANFEKFQAEHGG